MDTIDQDTGINGLIEFFKTKFTRFVITIIAGTMFGYAWAVIAYDVLQPRG